MLTRPFTRTSRRRDAAVPRARLGASALLAPAALAAALAAVTPARAQIPVVAVSVDDAGASTRVVLTHSTPVTWAVLDQSRRIEIVYAEPVDFDPPGLRLEGGILEGFRSPGRRRLVLDLGPGYQHFETFELRNPDRLIIDLQGDRDLGGPEAPFVPPSERRRRVIVIDPGHGGSESGAVGPTGLVEKDVTLDLARRLKAVLQRDRSVNVVLTRDEDRRVDLDERTAIANHNRADLFISIHLNASPRHGAYGAETYFLSTEATDAEARTLAALENRTFGVELAVPDAADVNSDGINPEQRVLDLVLWDLAQNRYLEQSMALAESVQTKLNELTSTRDRGVRQAPFHVLMGATMPAILVEAGFISNPKEEERFRGSEYRARVVDAMASAVEGFLQSLKQLSAPAPVSALPPGQR